MAARVLGRTRQTTWDVLPVAIALAHGALLLTWPSIPLVAVGLWWNANTISHHFIHRPFFRTRTANAGFSCYLSLVLGFPQSLWRARHLAHHNAVAGQRTRADLKPATLDFGASAALWGAMVLLAPGFLLAVYLPGFVFGLGLCYLQGYYEHAGGTTSHYGRLFNLLMFNDGYHAEHHVRPAADWRELPGHRISDSKASRWPAVLRWLEALNLCTLERMVLRFSLFQRFVLDRHDYAFRRLLVELSPASRVAIVGGGLFPRTALILRRLLPEATLVLIDHSESNLDIARKFLSSEQAEGGRQKEEGGRRKEEGGRRKAEGGRQKEEGGRRKAEGRRKKVSSRTPVGRSRLPSAFCLAPSGRSSRTPVGCSRLPSAFCLPPSGRSLPSAYCLPPSGRSQGSLEFLNQRFEVEMQCDADLLVIPLAFEGDRQALYEQPPVSAVIVHDWIWRPKGSSVIVSWVLLKRLNLVKR